MLTIQYMYTMPKIIVINYYYRLLSIHIFFENDILNIYVMYLKIILSLVCIIRKNILYFEYFLVLSNLK